MTESSHPTPPARPASVGTLASLQVGMPQTMGHEAALDPMDRPWTSGIFKHPVSGAREVTHLGVDGDGQADLRHHGGPDKAVLAYGVDHYQTWRVELPETEFSHGSFGENLSIEGLVEDDLAIGDTWSLGSVVLQISQPRQPCWKLARRLRVGDMVQRVQSTGRTGWYFRVLREGSLRAGDALRLVKRPHPRWTVSRANSIMHDPLSLREEARRLSELPELSESWRRTLRLRALGEMPDTSERVAGPRV